MTNELTGGETSVKVPKAECVIPGRGESELAIGRDDNIGNEVVVAVEDALGVAILILITRELPDNDGLV